jgi:hypothetical protein
VKTLALIKKLRAADLFIDDIEKRLRKAKQARGKIEAKLIKIFQASKVDSRRSGKLIADLSETSYPSISNRPAFLKYVIKNKAYDLFQNRVVPTALKDREEQGEEVPGITVFRKHSIKVRIKR